MSTDTGMFVVVEWNQASGRPSLADETIHDTREEAEQAAADLRAHSAGIGRREEFTVHELGEAIEREH